MDPLFFTINFNMHHISHIIILHRNWKGAQILKIYMCCIQNAAWDGHFVHSSFHGELQQKDRRTKSLMGLCFDGYMWFCITSAQYQTKANVSYLCLTPSSCSGFSIRTCTPIFILAFCRLKSSRAIFAFVILFVIAVGEVRNYDVWYVGILKQTYKISINRISFTYQGLHVSIY